MSSDELALLRAIAAAPADDLPRLVYADWLDEHGFAVRAEFIRLQCEIARLQAGPRAAVYQNVPLFRRQQELLDGYLSELLSPGLEKLTHGHPHFVRGFLDELAFDVTDFFDNAETIGAMLPVPRVSVEGVAEQHRSFTRLPGSQLKCIARIVMQDNRSAYPVTLNERDASDFRIAEGWFNLSSLDLEACLLGDPGVRELFINPLTFPVLDELDLSNNNLTDAGVIDLLNTGLLQRLRRLILGGNPITDQGAFELADRLGGSSRLEHLNLRFTNIGHAGQQALLARFGGRIDLF